MGKSDGSVLLSLCQILAGVPIICVNALQTLCTYIWGALNNGGSWLWDFGEGAGGVSPLLFAPSPCFTLLLSDRWVVVMWCPTLVLHNKLLQAKVKLCCF